MPTKKQTVEMGGPKPEEEMTLKELTVLLIKHFGHHEGLYDLAVHIRIGTGAIGLGNEIPLPGAVFGVAGVGLKRVEKLGVNTLNAEDVNPAPEPRKKTARSKV
jgi:hypothetical protein